LSDNSRISAGTKGGKELISIVGNFALCAAVKKILNTNIENSDIPSEA
jgi:hypothetical protein